MRARKMTFLRMGVVSLGIVGLAALGVARISAPSKDDAAVRVTVTQALEASRGLPIAASKLAPGPAAMTFRQTASRRFASLYTEPFLARKVETVQMNLDAPHPGNDDQAGIKHVRFDSIHVGDGSATVHATVTTWDNWTYKREWVELYTFDLVQRGGQWLIEKESVTYPPGEAPG